MTNTHRKLLLFYLIILLLNTSLFAQSQIVDPVDHYNVVWDSPSKNSSGSMPTGNGNIGINLWIEEGGDLVFYLARNDSWSENGRLLKLGRVRVKLSPNPFAKGKPFSLELKLKTSEIEIVAGQNESEVKVNIWVDANNPVVWVEAEGKDKFEIQVNFETWRETGYKLKTTTVSDMLNFDNHSTSSMNEDNPYPTIVYPDVIVPGKKDQIIWYHHNVKSLCELIMGVQGLGQYYKTMTDPLLYRTFGGAIKGDGLVSVIKKGEFGGPHPQYPTKMRAYSDRELKSEVPRKKHIFKVYTLMQHPTTVSKYLEALNKLTDDIDAIDIGDARKAHRDWWNTFWNRSWIRASGKDAEEVSKSYALQRYIFATNAMGNHPIKFNGYMYTVETQEGNNDPDWRRWGPGFWFMNTRALYWPMFTSGDHAFFDAYFDLYMNALPMAKERTKIYYGHEGAYIPEQIYFWGGYLTDHYGWDRTGRDPSFVEVRWTARLWQGILELLLIMNDYYMHTEDEEFLKTRLLPMAKEAITFYDLHYKRDENGKLYIWPAQSLEAWWDCVNPMPEVAGLRSVLDKLLKLPVKNIDAEQRQKWERLLSEVPPLPTRQLENGQTILAPAEKFAERANRENCELYAVFPYRLFSVGKPNLELAQLTYYNPFPDHFDNGVYVAFLGLVNEARDFVKSWSHPSDTTNNWASVPIRFKHQNLENFPLAYMSLLQAMLLQYDGEKIILFPTWPKEWDVDFKLHAPYNTIVEGTYKNSNLEHLKVTPKSRMKDVIQIQQN